MTSLLSTQQSLERSIDAILHLVGIDDAGDGSDPAVSEDYVRVLTDFVRGVMHASSGRLTSPDTLLAPLSPKGPVLRFLVLVHKNKKLQRKRIAATVSLLLQVRSWRAALRENAVLCASLPEDLEGILLEHTAQKGDRTDSEAQDNIAPPGDVDQSAAAQLLRQATEEILSASCGDQAITAFEHFRKAVTWIAQGGTSVDCRGVLESLEPKTRLLEFLTDFYEQKRKYRARVASALTRLLDFQTWRDVAISDPSLHASLRDLMVDDGKEVRADTFISAATNESNLDLVGAAALAATKGKLGVLYVRIIAASNLEGVERRPEEGASASLALFTRVRVGAGHARTKRTELICGTSNPEWDAAPFLFNVPSLDAVVTIDIFDSDITKDDLLGSLSLPVGNVDVMESLPTRFSWQTDYLWPPSRYPLRKVQTIEEAPCVGEQSNQQRGELELDLWFCPSPGVVSTSVGPASEEKARTLSAFLADGAVGTKRHSTMTTKVTADISVPDGTGVSTKVTVETVVLTEVESSAVDDTLSAKLATIKQNKSTPRSGLGWRLNQPDLSELLSQHSTAAWQRTACIVAAVLLGAALIAWRRPATRATT